jgi:hypothetical protein
MENQEIIGNAIAEMLGEPETAPVPEQQTDVQPETAEIEEATAATEVDETAPEVVEEAEDTKVPLKALQEERRKRQEYEAKIREYEAQQAPPQPQTLADMYLADPQGTEASIYNEIARLAQEDPYSNAVAIAKLQALVPKLEREAATRVQSEDSRFMQALNTAIPDFSQKVPVLTDFARNELGYSDDTIARLSNPKVVGPQAALDFVKSVAKQFDQKQAVRTVQQKAVQPKPTKVEQPGTGVPQSVETLSSLKAEAMRTGKWARYLEASGALPT